MAAESVDEPPLRIGVLAFRGTERALQEWVPHAEFLSARLAPRRFEVVPLALDDFRPAIAEKRIDFVLTATGHYVELEADGNVSPIATRLIQIATYRLCRPVERGSAAASGSRSAPGGTGNS